VKSTVRILVMAAVMLGFAACGDDDDRNDGREGKLNITLWGEDYISEGIPAEDDDGFSDGWSLKFDIFAINLGKLRVAEGNKSPVVDTDTFKIYDLAKYQEPEIIESFVVPAAKYTNTGYSIAAATADSQAGNADAAVVTKMKENGWSIFAEGTATHKDGRNVSFSWGFDSTTRYEPCHSEGDLLDDDDDDDDREEDIEITIHSDHLFMNSVAHDDPDLLFELVASAANDDKHIGNEELKALNIENSDDYDTGSYNLPTMWEYMLHMSKTLGHIDGEGHCEMN